MRRRPAPGRSAALGAAVTLCLLLLPAACGTPADPIDVAQPPTSVGSAPASDAVPQTVPATTEPTTPTSDAVPQAVPATTEPTTPTSAPGARAPAVPAELVGSWVSTDGGNAETIYEFDAGGEYRQAGVLLQKRPSGMFSFEIGAAGTVRVTGTRITLRPERGTQTLKDPDSATGGWQRPVSKTAETLRWRLTGDELVLTDGDGLAITYRRQ